MYILRLDFSMLVVRECVLLLLLYGRVSNTVLIACLALDSLDVVVASLTLHNVV